MQSLTVVAPFLGILGLIIAYLIYGYVKKQPNGSNVMQELEEGLEKFRMRIVIVCQFIEQFGGKKTTIEHVEIAAQSGKSFFAVGGFELSQCGEFFLVRIGKNNSAVRKNFDGPVKGGFRPFRALGDGTNFAGCLREKCDDLRCFGIIDGTYADSQILGQHD